MWFWVRHISIALVLVILAVLLLVNQDALFSGSGNNNSPATSSGSSFAKAYEKFREALSNTSDPIDEFIINLKLSDNTLEEDLTERKRFTKPMPRKWKGAVRDRRFRPGDTLKDKMEDFAQEEGLVMYWRLERDYKIKHYFQTDSTFLHTLAKTAQAIGSDFEVEVVAYFCPNERAAVIAKSPSGYLERNCIRAKI
ncbi:TcpQ domain-containing protein [Flocculibacter collagenilyticus]|uniref:TcpQ domain-containing protein n=1 Tax=Flocculibacter collagenilyticus TaxID=2744479 RepID=UPI0018F76F03|nr:TcpQ domain-containing protein [Flocculibacter collagenilyticus]